MNEALNIQSLHAFDSTRLSTMRRARGSTPAASQAGGADVPFASLRAAVRRVIASYRMYREARETVRMLRSLDDRALHDLGYHRSEIESVAIEAAMARAK